MRNNNVYVHTKPKRYSVVDNLNYAARHGVFNGHRYTLECLIDTIFENNLNHDNRLAKEIFDLYKARDFIGNDFTLRQKIEEAVDRAIERHDRYKRELDSKRRNRRY